MSEQLVTLARYFDPMAAQLAKLQLENEGILVELLGDNSSGVFAGLGGAFGTIELRVADEDLERSRRLLDEHQDPLGEDGDEDEAEPSTAIAERTALRGQAPPGRRAASAGDEPAGDPASAELTARPARQRPAHRTDRQPAPELAWTPDDLADRLWRSAVLGLFFFPIMLYAVWLLLRLGLMDGNLSPAGMRKLYGALVFLGLFALVVLTFFLLLRG